MVAGQAGVKDLRRDLKVDVAGGKADMADVNGLLEKLAAQGLQNAA